MARALHLAPISTWKYHTRLRLIAGIVAGFVGSLSIMAVVGVILVVTGTDIFTAARLISTAVLGSEATTGWVPIVVGTGLHLLTGTFFGALFGLLVPRMPANVYMVAGLIYGFLTFLVAGFVILPLIAPLMVATSINLAVLLLAHVVFGFVLGLAGGVVEVLASRPKPGRR